MIKVEVLDPLFNPAWCNAKRSLPVEPLETPRQYSNRLRETFKCRIEPQCDARNVYYIFDNDEDYTMFMLRWS